MAKLTYKYSFIYESKEKTIAELNKIQNEI